jgi:hypothetical protein
MKEINFYIAYLLTRHECVVIPGFGALVASSTPAFREEERGMFLSPAQLLSFNPEIKHNDGLLANFISAIKKISYREADSLAKQYVNHLNELLRSSKTVYIQWVGNFCLSSGNKIIFTPAAHLSCNAAYFGLNHFSLSPLKDLQSPDVASVNVPGEIITISVHRRTLAWTASVAAAVLALFLVSTPLNKQSGRQMQNASFFSVFQNTKVPEVIAAPNSGLTESLSTTSAVQLVPSSLSSFRYYIIIASLSTEKAAQIELSSLQKAGFTQAAIISKQGRYRIYIERFEEKNEAESYLNTFRRNNPKRADAWLFTSI